MRVLQLVAGEKWTGPAAVVFDQTAALIANPAGYHHNVIQRVYVEGV